MTNQEIIELIRCFDQSTVQSLKLSAEDFTLELCRGCEYVESPMYADAEHSVRPGIEILPAPKAGQASQSAIAGSVHVPAGKAAWQQNAEQEGMEDITAPLVGTFYTAAAPDQPPFVKVGDQVKKGDTLCLIEAMKMMNEVKAPCDCVIEEILIANGTLAEFGKTIMRYRPC